MAKRFVIEYPGEDGGRDRVECGTRAEADKLARYYRTALALNDVEVLELAAPSREAASVMLGIAKQGFSYAMRRAQYCGSIGQWFYDINRDEWTVTVSSSYVIRTFPIRKSWEA